MNTLVDKLKDKLKDTSAFVVECYKADTEAFLLFTFGVAFGTFLLTVVLGAF